MEDDNEVVITPPTKVRAREDVPWNIVQPIPEKNIYLSMLNSFYSPFMLNPLTNFTSPSLLTYYSQQPYKTAPVTVIQQSPFKENMINSKSSLDFVAEAILQLTKVL